MRTPKKGKVYFVPNYKNNLLTLFALLAGGALVVVAAMSLSWIALVLGLVLLVCGFGLVVLQPTHATVSSERVTLFYLFGIFSESAEWKNIESVYENNYKGGKKSDREKTFYFEGMESRSRRAFMRSEIEQSRTMRRYIVAFWGEPIKRSKKED